MTPSPCICNYVGINIINVKVYNKINIIAEIEIFVVGLVNQFLIDYQFSCLQNFSNIILLFILFFKMLYNHTLKSTYILINHIFWFNQLICTPKNFSFLLIYLKL